MNREAASTEWIASARGNQHSGIQYGDRTQLDIHEDGSTGPTWRAQLGIVALSVQRINQIASRGRRVAFAAVAILCLALPWAVHEHSPGFTPSHLVMPATVVVLLALVGMSYLLSTRRWSPPTRDSLDKRRR